MKKRTDRCHTDTKTRQSPLQYILYMYTVALEHS